jgi:hypothetical protein
MCTPTAACTQRDEAPGAGPSRRPGSRARAAQLRCTRVGAGNREREMPWTALVARRGERRIRRAALARAWRRCAPESAVRRSHPQARDGAGFARRARPRRQGSAGAGCGGRCGRTCARASLAVRGCPKPSRPDRGSGRVGTRAPGVFRGPRVSRARRDEAAVPCLTESLPPRAPASVSLRRARPAAGPAVLHHLVCCRRLGVLDGFEASKAPGGAP